MNNSFFTHKNVNLTIALKLTYLQKNGLPHLTLDQFKEALIAIKWREGQPHQLYEIVDDVFSCNADEIVAYLSRQAILDARKKSLEEYATLLGGNQS
jgi:hypothetical protein